MQHFSKNNNERKLNSENAIWLGTVFLGIGILVLIFTIQLIRLVITIDDCNPCPTVSQNIDSLFLNPIFDLIFGLGIILTVAGVAFIVYSVIKR
jgi:hypothetical protein